MVSSSPTFSSSLDSEESKSNDEEWSPCLPPPINWGTHPVTQPSASRRELQVDRPAHLYPGTPQVGPQRTPLWAHVDSSLIRSLPGGGYVVDIYGIMATLESEPAPLIDTPNVESALADPGHYRSEPALLPSHPNYHFITTASGQPRDKYYVVFVGKCVGIFTFWPYVKSLVVDLKNMATWQSFQSFEIAAQNYNKAKSLGLTRIRRLAGDDSIYGPECEGMQAAVLF